ncbi:hypothetical protein [Alkalicoccobacillus porphyridii]|uniref:DUF3139 domain-containing protein n=1 Tax=Alkalicoccobacillus porphyridii TaxID=2597270 RepID=A0A553ZWV3_9BACI|nr:hypothetical protein [Alkalicoccobacillus porphyridii]TSB45912.1 hypothetical protein FN960_13430 [Alkalicoccobacillus porphyridii]
MNNKKLLLIIVGATISIISLSTYLFLNGNPYIHYQMKQGVQEHFDQDGASRMLNVHMNSIYNRNAKNYPYFVEVYFDLNGVKGDYHYFVYEDDKVKASAAFSESRDSIDDIELFAD